MDDVKLKKIANRFSDAYIEDINKFFDMFERFRLEHTGLSQRDWYIITELLNLYVNIKSGVIGKDEGGKEQKGIFEKAERLKV